MLASMTRTPELELSKEEAKLILDSTGKVARHYAHGSMPEKTLDWINMISALGAVYGPRMMAAKMRQASEKARDVTPKPETPAKAQAPRPTVEEDFAMSNALHNATL